MSLLGLAIFIFLVIEGSKLIGSKAYVYIILLSCLNGFFMGNVLVKWVFDIIPSIQIKRLLNPKVLVK